MKLLGRTALITGATQGFGLNVAKSFVEEGARVAICGRNEKALLSAQKELMSFAHDKNQIFALSADIANKKEVDSLCAKVKEALGPIDILVANAGVYGPKGPIEEIDWDEWSEAIDINLKGTVLTCRAVLTDMKKRKHGKIILLSGGGATKPMPFLSAYAASKAAIVRFAETLAGEVSPFNIDVNTIAPGALNTRLLEEILAAGPEKVGNEFYEQSLKQKENGGTPLEKGAALCVFLASSESDGIKGKLISAVWDPWADLKHHQSVLENSDIYTLRRIVLADRNVILEKKSCV